MGTIITFANQKGGVGKTTTATNLGAALAEMGSTVLLIDFDSQGNLTSSVGADVEKPGIYRVLSGDFPARELVQTTTQERLSIIPGGGASGDTQRVRLRVR